MLLGPLRHVCLRAIRISEVLLRKLSDLDERFERRATDRLVFPDAAEVILGAAELSAYLEREA